MNELKVVNIIQETIKDSQTRKGYNACELYT